MGCWFMAKVGCYGCVMKKMLALLFAVALLPACVGYYGQAIRGQWELIHKPKPIEDILTHETTDDTLRRRLNIAVAARAFSTEQLGLPDNKSYTRYADLERPFVVWSVVATPRYSLDPETWCFPIAGCVNYKGYFKQKGAEKYANKLMGKGLDVYVGGVPAFSTLGKLNDPILNTMFRRGEIGVVSIIFHELAHQEIYVKGDTPFNEAFASAVEEEGIRRWFQQPGSDTQKLKSYHEDKKRRAGFTQIIESAQSRLREIYARNISDEEKEALKQQEFRRLKNDYQVLKRSWGGTGGYDTWFDRDLNNAHLASVANYESYLPAFRVILNQESKDLERFYDRCRLLADMDQEGRDRAMRELLAVMEEKAPGSRP